MSNRTQLVELKIRAQDETSGAFKKAGENLREFQQQAAKGVASAAGGEAAAGIQHAEEAYRGVFSRFRELNMEARKSGEVAFERVLKGGGVLGLTSFVVEGVTKGLGSITEAMEKVEKGEISAAQGSTEMAAGFIKSIPVLGHFLELGEAVGKVIWEEMVPGYKALADAQEAATKALREANADLRRSEGSESDNRQDEIKGRAAKKLAENAKQDKEYRAALAKIREDMDAETSEVGSEYRTGEASPELLKKEQFYLTNLKTLAQARKEIEQATENELRDVRKESAAKRSEEDRKSEDDILSLEAEARATALREQGLTAQAEMTLITAEYEKRRKAIVAEYDKAFEDAKHDEKRKQELQQQQAQRLTALQKSTVTSLANAGRKREQEEAEDIAAQLEQAEEAEKKKKEIGDRQADRDESLRHREQQAKIDALRAAGESGDREADLETRKLEIIEKINREREEYNRMLREGKDLTDQERQRILGLQKGLDKQQQAELSNLYLRDGGGSPFASAPEAGQRVSGVKDAFASQHQGDRQKMLEDAGKSREALEKMYTLIKQPEQWLMMVINRILTGSGGSPSDVIAGRV